MGRRRDVVMNLRFDIWLGLLMLFTASSAQATLDLPETKLHYKIQVRLLPDQRRLRGKEILRWTNPGRSSIASVPLHLYLNAFSHLETTFARGALGTRVNPEQLEHFLDLYPYPWGFIRPLTIRQNGRTLSFKAIAPDDGNPLDRTLIEVQLAEPVEPDHTLELTIEFKAQLPIPIARTGGVDDFFFVAQWFPKLAMFEIPGVRHAEKEHWDLHQFHAATEFYAEFADYDVHIGAPRGWKIGATGKENAVSPHVKQQAHIVWHRFKQHAVHDFAFVAGKALAIKNVRHRPPRAEQPVEVRIIVPARTASQIPRWQRVLLRSLDVMGRRIGPYPYKTLTLVMPPYRAIATGGMEYPTLIVGGLGDPIFDLSFLKHVRIPEMIIAHEFIHQYFYGIVATNEVEEAFLDEGFTEYWTSEVLQELFGPLTTYGYLLGRAFDGNAMKRYRLTQSMNKIHETLRTRSSFLMRSVHEQAYLRPWSIFRTAAAHFGQSILDAVFQAYYRRWAFKHPDFEDFLEVARETGGANLVRFIEEAYAKPEPPDYRVDKLEVKRIKMPRGIFLTARGLKKIPHGKIDISAFCDQTAQEFDEKVQMRISDPGWIEAGLSHRGKILNERIKPRRDKKNADNKQQKDVYYQSLVQLQGPGWKNLPVEVLFRFSDGVLLKTTWDGKSTWREYRFCRKAPLSEVELDPQNKLSVDANFLNNARSYKADRRFVFGWGIWLGAALQWLSSTVTQWL